MKHLLIGDGLTQAKWEFFKKNFTEDFTFPWFNGVEFRVHSRDNIDYYISESSYGTFVRISDIDHISMHNHDLFMVESEVTRDSIVSLLYAQLVIKITNNNPFINSKGQFRRTSEKLLLDLAGTRPLDSGEIVLLARLANTPAHLTLNNTVKVTMVFTGLITPVRVGIHRVHRAGLRLRTGSISWCMVHATNLSLHNYVYVDGTYQPHDYIEEHPDEDYIIHTYSTKAQNKLAFKGKSKAVKFDEKFTGYYEKYLREVGASLPKYNPASPLYLGIELEYEVSGSRENAIPSVMDYLKGHVILKADGSIHNGFEVVSCPATIEEHKEAFKPFFDNFPSKLSTPSNTGMHIHVSRAPLSFTTQGRMVAFMNNSENQSFIEQVGGRNLNTYCCIDSSRKESYVLRRDSGQRYNTLNTANRDTLEFRIFACVTQYDKLVSAMEFVIAMTEYCKPCSTDVGLQEFRKASNFIKWLTTNKKDYPTLTKHLGIYKPKEIPQQFRKEAV